MLKRDIKKQDLRMWSLLYSLWVVGVMFYPRQSNCGFHKRCVISDELIGCSNDLVIRCKHAYVCKISHSYLPQ